MQHRLVGHLDMQRTRRRPRNRPRPCAMPRRSRRAHDAAGDLAAIGDQDLAEHRHGLCPPPPVRLALLEEGGDALLAFGGGARIGDPPGGVAPQRLVDLTRPPRARIRSFAARCAAGPPSAGGRRMRRPARLPASSGWHHLDATRPSFGAVGGVEALGGQEIAPAGARADRRDDVGRDHRRDEAEPHFGQAEAGAARRRWRCRSRRPGRRRRRRRHPGPGEHRLGAAIDRCHQVGQRHGVALIGVARLVAPCAASSRDRRRRRSSGRWRASTTTRTPSSSPTVAEGLRSARRSAARRRRCASPAGSAAPSATLAAFSISRSRPCQLTSGTRRSVVGSIGALSAADRPSASVMRVSAGSMMPSSHSRALA